MEKIKAVFFDFEGTLVDFQWQLDAAIEETLGALVCVGFKREDYGSSPGYAHIYNHTLQLAARSEAPVDGTTARRIMDLIFDRYDADALTRWRAYPNSKEVLSSLKENSFRLALISNVGKNALTEALRRFGLLPFLEVIVSRNEMERIKPNSEGLIATASRLNINPDQVLFVGDSRNDVSSAHAAGMWACYLKGGEDNDEAIKEFSPDVTIETLSSLTQLLGIA